MGNQLQYQNRSIYIFLFFVLLNFTCQNLINNGLKFITYDVTKSMELVSILGSVSAFFYITIGLFSGIVVDFFKKTKFVNVEIVVNSATSIILIILLESNLINIYSIIFFILAKELITVFSSPAKNTIFYELIDNKSTLKWISRRSIIVTATPILSSLILSFCVDDVKYILILYLLLNVLSIFVFNLCNYKDAGKKNDDKLVYSIRKKFRDFIYFLGENKIVYYLFVYSFFKTFFIFWPMSSGALFKFGIGNTESQKLFLYTSILLGIVSIISTYFVGMKYKHFTIGFFIFGVFLSGIGIILLGFSTSNYFSIASLCILYIGLVFSQLSNAFILKHHLPSEFMSHGLSISVIPYYLADIFSGVFFALLIKYVSVNNLLLFCGLSLVILSVHFIFNKSLDLFHKSKNDHPFA